jgi:hypothetical protein
VRSAADAVNARRLTAGKTRCGLPSRIVSSRILLAGRTANVGPSGAPRAHGPWRLWLARNVQRRWVSSTPHGHSTSWPRARRCVSSLPPLRQEAWAFASRGLLCAPRHRHSHGWTCCCSTLPMLNAHRFGSAGLPGIAVAALAAPAPLDLSARRHRPADACTQGVHGRRLVGGSTPGSLGPYCRLRTQDAARADLPTRTERGTRHRAPGKAPLPPPRSTTALLWYGAEHHGTQPGP